MQPGFTILSDMTELAKISEPLAQLFAQVQHMLNGRGRGLIATMYAPGNNHPHEESTPEQPQRIFTDRWEADNFLDELPMEG